MTKEIRIFVSDDFDFASLHVQRDVATGDLELEWKKLEGILQHSGNDPKSVFDDDELLALLLTSLYQAHRDGGGAIDLVQEGILAEVAAERDFGSRVQRAPSRLQ